MCLLTTEEVTAKEEMNMSRLCARQRGRRSVKVISWVGALRLGDILCSTNASCSCLPTPQNNQRERAGRAERGMEGNWECNPSDMWTCPQLNTGGNYKVPSGKYNFSPEGCLSVYTVSSYRGPRTPQRKNHVFHFSRHIPAHTHDEAPPDVQHG